MINKDITTRLTTFGSKLSPDLLKEFRQILQDFATIYYEVGETFKMTMIELIPDKVVRSSTEGAAPILTPTVKNVNILTNFKPSAKIEDIAIALARNLVQQKEEKK